MYGFRTRCSLADHYLFFLPVTSTTNLRQQARTLPPHRGAKKWAKTNQERRRLSGWPMATTLRLATEAELKAWYLANNPTLGWAAPRRVYLQWKSLHQVCTSYATSLHRKLILVYTKTEIVQTSLHTVYTWKVTKLKQVYTKFAKPRQKFTRSLQNQDKGLHKVWKYREKFTLSLKKPEKSLHKVWKNKVWIALKKVYTKFTQSLHSTEKSLHKVYDEQTV